MPIDKFGRHFQSHEEPQTFLVELQDVSTLGSTNLITLIAGNVNKKSEFIFLGGTAKDGEDFFKFPINGTISSVKTNNANIKVFINSKELDINKLTGINININDVLKVVSIGKHPREFGMYITVLTPLQSFK